MMPHSSRNILQFGPDYKNTRASLTSVQQISCKVYIKKEADDFQRRFRSDSSATSQRLEGSEETRYQISIRIT